MTLQLAGPPGPEGADVVLAATLVASGVVIAMWLPGSFNTGAWATGIILVAFAFLRRHWVKTRPA